MSNVLLQVTYHHSARRWLKEVHLPDFRNVAGYVSVTIARKGDVVQLSMVVPELTWQAYLKSEDRERISAEAQANGFMNAEVWEDAVVISDDDDSPSGHDPESRGGGNLESELGFSGGERGGRG